MTVTTATLKKLVGIEFEFKSSLDDFLQTVLDNKLVLEYNSGSNTPAARTSSLNSFVSCGPSMGFEAKKFAYGTLELIVNALVNNPDVPEDPYANELNDQLVNITRYVGITGEGDYHFMVAVYNLTVTLSEILDNVVPVGPIVTYTLTDGGSGYTIDGADADETGVVFLGTLALGDQTDPDQYTNAVFEATIASGVVTAITALTDGGDGFAVGDVVSLDIDTGTAGQGSATGSGATVTVNSVG
jgi:hypothetical protein